VFDTFARRKKFDERRNLMKFVPSKKFSSAAKALCAVTILVVLGLLLSAYFKPSASVYPDVKSPTRPLRIEQMGLEVRVASPQWIEKVAGQDVAKVIEKAQAANAPWLTMWAIKDCFQLSYTDVGYAVFLPVEEFGSAVTREFPALTPATKQNYSGPYNRAGGYYDIAEFIILGGLLGEGVSVRQVKHSVKQYPDQAETEFFSLRGTITGALVPKLVSRLLGSLAEDKLSKLEYDPHGKWTPDSVGNPNKLKYEILLLKNSFKLFSSNYEAYNEAGERVAQFRATYRYEPALTRYASGNYPAIIWQEMRHPAIAYVDGSSTPTRFEREAVAHRTIYCRVVDGVWVTAEVVEVSDPGYDLNEREKERRELSANLTVSDDLVVRRTKNQPNDRWLEILF